jgi:hypothetical protein
MARIAVTYTLEPRDLRAFYRYARKHLPGPRRIRHAVGVFLAAGRLCLAWSAHELSPGLRITYFFVLPVVFWGLFQLLTFVLTRIEQWRMLTSDKQRSILCEHTLTLADDALVEVSPFNESRMLREGLYRVVDTVEYIYILASVHSALIAPRREFLTAENARQFYEEAVRLHSKAQRITG